MHPRSFIDLWIQVRETILQQPLPCLNFDLFPMLCQRHKNAFEINVEFLQRNFKVRTKTKFQNMFPNRTLLTFQATKVLKADQNLYSSHFSGTRLLLILKDASVMSSSLVPAERWSIQRNKKVFPFMQAYIFIYLFIYLNSAAFPASGEFSYINCLCAQMPPIINLQVSLITAYSHWSQVEGYQLWWLNTTHIMWALFTVLSLNLGSKMSENSHQQSLLSTPAVPWILFSSLPSFSGKYLKTGCRLKQEEFSKHYSILLNLESSLTIQHFFFPKP